MLIALECCEGSASRAFRTAIATAAALALAHVQWCTCRIVRELLKADGGLGSSACKRPVDR